jgi:hypothetical protein
MPFEAFVHASDIQFLQPCIFIHITGGFLRQGLVATVAVEAIASTEAFEHSAEEFALSHSRHFRHGATNSS